MRGNKFLLKIGAIIAVLVLGVATSFLFSKNMKEVQAEDTSLFNRSYASQEYDDGVIFSAEQIYFDKNAKSNSLFYDQNIKTPLTNILGYGGNNYFANLNSNFAQPNFVSENDIGGKKIIYPGDFALIDDITPMNVYNENGQSVSLKQGVMMTLGGYIYEDGTMYTNSHANGVDGNNNPIYDKMSKLTYVGITIYRNGVKITDTADSENISLRTYNSGLYFDFVYFLEAIKDNEGYYQIDLSYTLEGNSNVNHSFDFYMLLKTSYTSPQEVNGLSYTSFPTFENVTPNGDKYYQFINNDQMPVLTYDYKHYDLEYAYKVNDLITNVKVIYENLLNQGINRLKLVSTTNGISTEKYYDIVRNNSIVSLLFSNIGTYQFNFKYVYNYGGDRLVIDNLSIESMQLDIHGYEIKYAKYGFSASTFRKLTIAQNGVVVVPVNGFSVAEADILKDIDLGYVYEFDENSVHKSGFVENTESPNTATTYNVESKKFETLPNFVNTDQGGVWLELNDKYNLTDSYYLYSSSPFVTENDYSSLKKDFQKDTTFTRLGYYFVCVKYSCDSVGDAQTQYFAFRISSSTANVSLRTTDAETIENKLSNDGRIYSNQFTNKNVYAEWNDTGTFESKQNAYLYYSNKGGNPYQSKEVLLNFARGGSNSALTKEVFDKNTRLIKNSGSYLLEIQIVGSQTRVYYYFVIDKEDISGIETLGVSSAFIGNNAVYSVATDANNKPIRYTSSFVISQNFTMWWNDKPSGAKITGTYKFAPIVYKKQSDEIQTVTLNGITYSYLKADYKLGTVSYEMSIEKPATQYALVNTDNVLTKQGVYWFELVDEAGNKMNYSVVVDKTEAKILATTSSGVKLSSGRTSSEDVTFEWGTHKIIDLSLSKTGTESNLETFYNLFGKSSQDKYFTATTSNFDDISKMLVDDDSNVKLAVACDKVDINSMGNVLTIKSNGTYYIASGDWTDRFEFVNGHSVLLKPVMREWAYTLKLFGENQKYSTDSASFFSIILNKDKSEGTVKSKNEEKDEFSTNIYTYNDEYTEEKLKQNYLNGQATDDGIVVFEWLSGVGTETEVAEVYYEYYPLMTQEELNGYQANNPDYEFYPYSKTSTKHYIFGGDSNAQNYNIVEINGKTFYRSHYINVGYVSYYEGNVIVSKNATKPGMYVIVRRYKNEIAKNQDATIRNYVFFVDRNNIIDYSTSGNSSRKVVGNHIDFLMQDVLSFDSFTEKVSSVNFAGKEYPVYLQSNKLPLSIRIPTGKYASKVGSNIVKTSNSVSGGLKFNLYYIDSQNYLGKGKDSGFKLFNMVDMQKVGTAYTTEGYITYLLNTSSLYVQDGNGDNINRYLKACGKTGAQYLSLPGVYIVEICDNVGKVAKLDKSYEMEDCNRLYIGIEITSNCPTVDANAGKNDNGVNLGTDRIETSLTDGGKFNTNKTYVMYELSSVDENNTNAQIDDRYIVISRKDVETGKEEIYFNSVINSGVVNTSSILNGTSRNIIDKSSNSKTVVWLDTGIRFDGNKITQYKEYVYTIRVRYILYNNETGYYTYNILNPYNSNEIVDTKSFYESTFDVNIDRTPILENLENAINGGTVLPNQKDFLTDYVQAMLNENNYNKNDFDQYSYLDKLKDGQRTNLAYNTLAYKDNNNDVNFSVTNKAYYYLLENEQSKAEYVNYAIRVVGNMKVNTSLGNIYRRKISNDKLISLLPITSKYNEVGYSKFDRNDLSSSGFVLINSISDATWSTILSDEGLYEIVEIDDCGNYTQYVVYYNDIDTKNYNIELVFEDMMTYSEGQRYEYTVSLDFASIDQDNALTFNPMLTIERNDNVIVSANTFGLTGLMSVVDSFGNQFSKDVDNKGNNVSNYDTYYKVILNYTKNETNQEKVFYSNVQNYNLAQFLFENIKENRNYKLTIIDRFKSSLSFDLSVNKDIYDMKLTTDDFNAESESVGEGVQYVLIPSKLNSHNEDFTFYAKELSLVDNTAKTTVVYTLNSRGEIDSYLDNGVLYTYKGGVFVPDDEKKENVQKPIDKIILTTGHYYTVNITDMIGGKYVVDNIFAGSADLSSFNIEFVGAYTSYNNEYFTASDVNISYDTNAFDGIRIKIYQDETLIRDEVLDDTGLGEYISSQSVVDNRKIFTLKPFNYNKLLARTGANLQYVVSFMNNGIKKKESVIFIDNRVPALSIISEKGEDKTNIVRIDYEVFDTANSQTDFDTDKLFGYTPTLSLSETIKLSWEDVQNINYSIYNFTYFDTKLYLYSFDSRDDWSRKEFSSADNMYQWISPKENSIGRYVFVYALYNNDKQCMMYKAYSFNISSTANAMYEVQDADGNIKEYDGIIKGDKIQNMVGNWTGLKNSFGLLENLEEGATEQDKVKYERYSKFVNQNIPVYISNSTLNVVPNGDNGVTSVSYTDNLTDYYTLNLYKVFNDVHTTYVIILNVQPTSQLAVFTPSDNPIRYVNDNVLPINIAVATVNDLGRLYFPSFFKGNMTSTSKAKDLLKLNELYLEVYYKFSEIDKKYVGKVFGKNVFGEDGVAIDSKYIDFKSSGAYQIYLRDIAGNTHSWGTTTAGDVADYLTLNVVSEVLTSVNGNAPIDYAYYNGEVTVAVCFNNLYDNASTTIKAYHNGSNNEYITTEGGRKTNFLSSYTFTEYGTYKVEISAKRDGVDIKKILVFSIINSDEARIALDFTSINKYNIEKVVNYTTGSDVSDIFKFLLNEGFIYSKLITYDRLSTENAFGSTMGKQTFEVEYSVSNDELLPIRHQSFRFTINNQTPSIKSSVAPGESTTKEITLTLNPQTIYRQVGDCYVMVNDRVVLVINAQNSNDRTMNLTLKDVSVYYVRIMSDSGRVITSFQVTIKEPLNAWSIVLIVAVVLLVVGIITVFIVLRTKMRVR